MAPFFVCFVNVLHVNCLIYYNARLIKYNTTLKPLFLTVLVSVLMIDVSGHSFGII